MRNGYKIFDADTHVRPAAETLIPYLDPDLRQLADEESNKVPVLVGMAGEIKQQPYRHYFRFGRGEGGWSSGKPRILGEAGPREGAERHFQTFMGRKLPTEGGGDYDAEVRLRDMDEEGTDVHMIVPGGVVSHPDPTKAIGFIRANHRYTNEFCGHAPHRLKSLIVVDGRCIDESVEEMKRWGTSAWAVGIQPHLPVGSPIDHPDLEPIWATAESLGLAVVHHSFSDGYPGYRDLWESPFLGRTASHPWGAMRAVAAFVGGGIMERHPALRFGILESGFGWLPFWARRMDDQAIYMGYLPEGLQKLSEYLTGGRFFAGIVLHEGEDMVRLVTELMGDHMLMFGSDYPHAESRFPDSVDLVLSWDSLQAEARQKLLWDNAVRFFGEP